VSLNIKNPETYRLVRALAEATGESMTEAVTTAVRERLERVTHDFEDDDIHELVEEIGRRVPEGFFDVDVDRLFYDERGLPL
jgi:antitoxin VapB